MMRAKMPALAGLFALIGLLIGCKEGTVEPQLTGSIDGVVLDYETSDPLAGTSITTSPPTGAFVTDDEGRFRLVDIEAGNYTINAKRPGYQSNSVTVSVSENEETSASIFLESEEEDEETSKGMTIDITNWWNRTEGDSAFVEVEYRVQNDGSEDIPSYEVYFRIHSGDETYYQEETGADLRIDQANVRHFEKYIRSNPADSVAVDGFWME